MVALPPRGAAEFRSLASEEAVALCAHALDLVRFACWILGRFGAVVRRLGPSWGRLGAVLGRLGPSWADLGAVSGRLWAVLGRLGAVLGPSWAILGPSWGDLGAVSPKLSRRSAEDRR